jgi:hypothetical protein
MRKEPDERRESSSWVATLLWSLAHRPGSAGWPPKRSHLPATRFTRRCKTSSGATHLRSMRWAALRRTTASICGLWNWMYSRRSHGVRAGRGVSPRQLADSYDINVVGTQRVNRAVLPHMRRQQQGLLVWVSSSSSAGGTPPCAFEIHHQRPCDLPPTQGRSPFRPTPMRGRCPTTHPPRCRHRRRGQDRVRLCTHVGEGPGEQSGMAPMRGGAPATEQPCLRQDERTCTHRRQTPDARRRVRVGTDVSASTSAGSMGRPTRSSPPATTTVSAESMDETRRVTANRVPIEVVTSCPSTDAISSE